MLTRKDGGLFLRRQPRRLLFSSEMITILSTSVSAQEGQDSLLLRQCPQRRAQSSQTLRWFVEWVIQVFPNTRNSIVNSLPIDSVQSKAKQSKAEYSNAKRFCRICPKVLEVQDQSAHVADDPDKSIDYLSSL
jgi:hypothetical protein